MCSETDSLPPIFARPKYPATEDSLTLSSADGSNLLAALARPETAYSVGVVVLPDMRGLSTFYQQLSARLAEQGYAALAIDYFGRTAGTGPRPENFPFMEHVMKLSGKTVSDDIAAAVDYLRSPEGGSCDKLLALGFCFGGRQAFFASAPRFNLAGVIGFYGALSFYPNGAAGPLQRVSELSSPILGLFGGADAGIPPSDVAAFDQALTAAGVEHETITYPNAPHSFFDIKYKEHATACADAWRRLLAFVAVHSAPRS